MFIFEIFLVDYEEGMVSQGNVMGGRLWDGSEVADVSDYFLDWIADAGCGLRIGSIVVEKMKFCEFWRSGG